MIVTCTCLCLISKFCVVGAFRRTVWSAAYSAGSLCFPPERLLTSCSTFKLRASHQIFAQYRRLFLISAARLQCVTSMGSVVRNSPPAKTNSLNCPCFQGSCFNDSYHYYNSCCIPLPLLRSCYYICIYNIQVHLCSKVFLPPLPLLSQSCI